MTHPYHQYALDVVARTVPACELVVLACQRYLDDLEHGHERGLRFSHEHAQLALDFLELTRHSKGKWAGQPFKSSPWQAFITAQAWGWLREDGTRRFRIVYEEVPRKNGKSTRAAALGLLLMLGDGEPGAEVYSAATKRDQAKIVWAEARRMVRKSPALSKRLGHNNISIFDTRTDSFFQPLGADADTLDGLNIHGGVVDELHAHKTRDMVDVLDTATGAREQPLIYYITTAGYDRASVCWEYHEYAEQVVRGILKDDEWLVYNATIDKGDKWDDPETWKKANPNYGVSVNPDDLKRKARKASHTPAAQNAFMRKHLDVWTEQADRWITLDAWDKCRRDYTEPELLGLDAYAGLDVSASKDITALALLVPDDDGVLRTLVRAWVPESRVDARENRYRASYREWVDSGVLLTTPGVVIDHRYILEQVVTDAAQFNLKSLAIDKLFNGHQLSLEMAEEGVNVFYMGQTNVDLAIPMREYEARLLGEKIVHNGNPLLRWAVANVVAREDVRGNLHPDRAQSQGKIDPFMASLFALDRAIRPGDSTAKKLKHGIRFV